MTIESAFQRLLGRDPHPDELSDLYRMKESLRLGDDDPLWIIIFALQHYQTLYRTIPTEIEAATGRLAAEIDRLNGADTQRRPSPASSPLRPAGKRRPWMIAVAVVGGIVAFVAGVSVGGLGQAKPLLPSMSEQALSSCFNGNGRVENRGGARYCFPVNPDGKVLGYRLQ